MIIYLVLTDFGHTLFTDTLIIIVNLLNVVSVRMDTGLQHLRILLQIVDFPAPLAHEVGVGHHVGVIAGVALIDGQRADGSLLAEQLQRVVDGGLRQRGHGW